MIELGTIIYPYRSFKAVSSEILNQYSYLDLNITIHLREDTAIYIEDDTSYFVNLNSVTISSYSETSLAPGRASIIPTAISQHGISSRAAFHLLNHTELNISEVIAKKNYGDSELDKLQSTQVTLKILETSFSLINVDVYRDPIDYNLAKYFLFPINLQNRDVLIKNVDFNVTGTILYTPDPLNAYLENISIDFYSLINGFLMSTL